uniref:Putative vinyl chloride reductive dehalogenase bvcA n=3 Tax=Dehalococcoides TaxID=61434 RepID=Q5YD55_DEHMB|nr:putative vinyl chloride reductive dehalogenase bvcA [Dehalococcoides mccartyi BAV1]
MHNFHCTISRRDFMKGLGLAGAGIGAATSVMPNFHDLDEVISAASAETSSLSGKSLNNFPWYVKERDFENPTIDIDWSILARNDGYNHQGAYWGPVPENGDDKRYPDPADQCLTLPEKRDLYLAWAKQQFPDWEPGINGHGPTRDEALWFASSTGGIGRYRIPGTQQMMSTMRLDGSTGGWGYFNQPPAAVWGGKYPRWEGTPEENTLMMRTVCQFFGYSSIGVMPITSNTKKLFFEKQIPFQFMAGDPGVFGGTGNVQFDVPLPKTPVPIVWEEVDKGYYNDQKIVIPNKANWVLTMTMPLPEDRFKRSLGWSLDASSMIAYPQMAFNGGRVQTFLKALGYQGLGGDVAMWGPGGAFGVMSGLSEQGRAANEISPKYGSATKGSNRLVCDLPMVPTKPIDAGIHKFCETCGICTTVCPSNAIQVGPPQWSNNRWDNTPGYLGYRLNWGRCVLCTNCETYCPFFNMTNGSLIHNVVRSTVAATPVFNSFFRQMEHTFGYGMKDDLNDWWNQSHKPW